MFKRVIFLVVVFLLLLSSFVFANDYPSSIPSSLRPLLDTLDYDFVVVKNTSNQLLVFEILSGGAMTVSSNEYYDGITARFISYDLSNWRSASGGNTIEFDDDILYSTVNLYDRDTGQVFFWGKMDLPQVIQMEVEGILPQMIQVGGTVFGKILMTFGLILVVPLVTRLIRRWAF